jgi:O-antigen ligase
MRTLSSAPPEPRSSGREPRPPVTAGGFLTSALLVVILAAAPLVLGAARLWFELPLLEIVALLLLVQAGRLGFSQARRVRLDLIDLAVVVFTVYAVARWLTSPAEYFSRLEILNVLGYATIFFTCRHGLARRSYGLLLLGLLVALGVFETGFGYYLSNHLDWLPFGPTETLHRYYAPRWIGTFASPNHYGAFLVMGMSAALAFASFSKFSWPVRIVFFYLAAVMLAGIICSASRGSMLGACGSIAALSIFGVRYGMVRWWLPVVGGVLLIGAFVLILSQSLVVQSRLDEVRQTLNHGSLDNYFRIKLAHDALRIAADHPFFGTGPATFVFIHPRYQDNTFSLLAVLAHDDYLNTLDDYGGVGLAIVLFFIFAVTGKFFRRPRASSRWQDRVLLVGGFTAWSALLVHSFFDYNMHIPANALMLMALIGMALRRFASEPEQPRTGLTLPAIPLAIVLAAIGLAYGAEVGRTAISDIIYEHAVARSLDATSNDSVAAAQEALKFDPDNVRALVFLGDIQRVEAAHDDRPEDIAKRMSLGEKAAAAYSEALRQNPLDDTIEASLGLTFDLMYRYPEAYFCYANALRHQPYDGQFWFRLGNHFWETGLLQQAEQAYQMGLHCPHGAKENIEPAQEIRGYLEAQGIPLPPVGTDPLKPQPVVEPVTVP